MRIFFFRDFTDLGERYEAKLTFLCFPLPKVMFTLFFLFFLSIYWVFIFPLHTFRFIVFFFLFIYFRDMINFDDQIFNT